MKNLHFYRVSDANIAAVYGKLSKLLSGSTTRIDEITSLRQIDEIRFLKKKDLTDACIEINWFALMRNKISIYKNDTVEFKGTRTVIIHYRDMSLPKKIVFYVVSKNR